MRIDDEEHARKLSQILYALEDAVEVGQLILEPLRFLLWQSGELAALLLLHEIVVARDPPLDGDEVRQEAAQPALIDVVHVGALGLFGDRLLRLLFGADEQDLLAAACGGAHETVRVLEARQRLLQIDDVDAVALHEDEALHLRVPAAGLMAEMDAALEELFHSYDGHVGSGPPLFLASAPVIPDEGPAIRPNRALLGALGHRGGRPGRRAQSGLRIRSGNVRS